MTKSDKTVPTSAELQQKIEGLDTALSDAEADFDRYSSEVVAGVSDAGKRVADANARIERLKVERKILDRALASARQREAEADVAALEAERAKHMAVARSNASKLLDAANSVDEAITALLAALDQLGDAEARTRASARLAGVPGSISIRGRSSLVAHAHECLKRRQSPYALRPDERDRVADIARAGWAFLLDETNEVEAA